MIGDIEYTEEKKRYIFPMALRRIHQRKTTNKIGKRIGKTLTMEEKEGKIRRPMKPHSAIPSSEFKEKK